MGAVFISYRRGDSEGQARSLFTDLAKHLGRDAVFMDVDSIALGSDFRQVLSDRLESCDLMLTLIGPSWIDIKDAAGNRRLDSPTDFVRQEVSAALKRKIPVTPVFIQGAQMPPADRLPDDLKDLVFRNGFELSHQRWESDVKEMVKRLGLGQIRTESHPVEPGQPGLVTKPGSGVGGMGAHAPAPAPSGPVAAKAGFSLQKKHFAIGAIALLVLIVTLVNSGSGDSSGVAVAPESPAFVATVTPDSATFYFAIADTTQTWQWNLALTPNKTDEYSWTVGFGDTSPLSFQAYYFKGAEGAVEEGDLGSLIERLSAAAWEGGNEPPGLTVSRKREGDGLRLTVRGPNLQAAFASRPAEATFEIKLPGKPLRTMNVPITYVEQ